MLPAAEAVVPGDLAAGSTTGIEDYMTPDPVTGTTWLVEMDGHAATTANGSAPMVEAFVYDSMTDQVTMHIGGANHTLDYDAFMGDYWMNFGAIRTEFQPYDDPAVSQYGTFAYVYYEDDAGFVEYYSYYGLKTPSGEMPVEGTGTYAGVFDGVVNSDIPGIPYDYVSGTVDLVASFASGGGSLTFDSSGSGIGTTYILAGDATITGNTYLGTVSGSFSDGTNTVYFSAANSSLAGAFYGPDQTSGTVGETAGAVQAASDAGGLRQGEIAGGFWAQQTGYTIP